MASTIVDGPSTRSFDGSPLRCSFGHPLREEGGTIRVLTSRHHDVAMAVREATRNAARSHGLEVDASWCPSDLDEGLGAVALTVVDLTAVDVPILTVDGRQISRIPDPDSLIRAGVALGALGREGVLAVQDVSRGGLARLPMLDVVQVDMQAGASAAVDVLSAAVSRRLARMVSPDAGS